MDFKNAYIQDYKNEANQEDINAFDAKDRSYGRR